MTQVLLPAQCELPAWPPARTLDGAFGAATGVLQAARQLRAAATFASGAKDKSAAPLRVVPSLECTGAARVVFLHTRFGVARALSKGAWEKMSHMGVLLLSATMWERGCAESEAIFLESIGAAECRTLALPVVYRRLVIARDPAAPKLPFHRDPGVRRAALDVLAARIAAVARANARLTLVLLISKATLGELRVRCQRLLPSHRHVQFSTASTEMSAIRGGHAAAHCVLYASVAGMQGLDLPGLVGAVVIAQPLRFPHGADHQWEMLRGGASREWSTRLYHAGEMQLTMQSVGRLLRSERDRGLVVFCGVEGDGVEGRIARQYGASAVHASDARIAEWCDNGE